MWNYIILLCAVLFYCYRSSFFQKVQTFEYSVQLPEKFDGVLAVNKKLDNVEKLHENSIHWPESMAIKDGNLYTGLGDGRIVKITSTEVIDVCQIGNKCEGQHEEHICGRPLGMKFAKNGLLYVVDAYHGLFSIDVATGKKQQLLSSSILVDGQPLTFLNDLVIDENTQSIYLSQSSTKWNLSMVIVSIIEHESSGRLLKYDLKSKQLSVVLKNLAFPNGIELTKDGSALLVAQINKQNIFKYFIQGPKKGKMENLALILPGSPDNISRTKRGTYWVGIASAHTTNTTAFHDKLCDRPFWRKLLLHVHKLSTTPITFFLKMLPYKWIKDLGFEIDTLRFFVELMPSHGIIIEIDENGKILQSLHSPEGKISFISEVLEHDGYLYLGSWRNNFLGKLKL